MAELHKALECLRPKEFSNVPTGNLKTFLPDILSNAELIANSVPPPPNGTPYESAQRTRTSPQPAANAADLTKSDARRPPPAKEHEALQKAWGKAVKLGAQQAATGMSVYKMAGHDRHGAWFARSSVHEGLGFAKWKRMMQREFPESLEVQGGPGEGNIRGIGGDQRLEDMTVDGVGNLQGENAKWQLLRRCTDGNSLPAFCTVPRPDVTTGVHHAAHHVRERSQRRLQDRLYGTTTLDGCFDTCHTPGRSAA